jgi:cellulose synthase (UDP-forming)
MSIGAASNLTRKPVAGSLPGRFDDQFTLRDAGVLTPIELGGQVRSQSMNFSLPEMELTQKASLHLYYHLAAAQAAQSGTVRVLLNSTEVATLTVPRAVDRAALLEQEIALPADLLVHQNQLTFAYGGQP